MDIQWQAISRQTRRGTRPLFLFDSAYSLLETFLSTDVRGQAERFREALRQVEAGEVPMLELHGNVCSVLVGRERVVVLDSLAPDGVGKACVVCRASFLAVLDAWEAAWSETGELS